MDGFWRSDTDRPTVVGIVCRQVYIGANDWRHIGTANRCLKNHYTKSNSYLKNEFKLWLDWIAIKQPQGFYMLGKN